ncbi:acyl carrier protein [Sphaerisporangium fuscum]|uniref:acyl carrier protein n=1 Tax=Sphaerisporangium fuscum TaxID=2835868 RepID=UPI001BDDBC2E|nr:acyl carrier protein [Sphaerisporangium fuscum]
MSDLDLDQLRTIMRGCGVAESTDLDGEILDLTFEQLGYDSLAVLEIQGQLEQRYGVLMTDDALEKTRSPREMLEFVNNLITAGA